MLPRPPIRPPRTLVRMRPTASSSQVAGSQMPRKQSPHEAPPVVCALGAAWTTGAATHSTRHRTNPVASLATGIARRAGLVPPDDLAAGLCQALISAPDGAPN